MTPRLRRRDGQNTKSAAQRARNLFVILAIAVMLAASSFLRAEEGPSIFRWTTRDGHSFQARFVRLQGSSVVVVRDGWEFTVPISSLPLVSVESARHQAPRGPLPISPVVPAEPPAPVASFTFGPSILAFCRENVGKRVGSGQCASLAGEALQSAGAARRAGPDWPGEGDYVWGKLVAFVEAGFVGVKGIHELAAVEPGDIVQFHNARFAGLNHSDSGTYRMEARHHTAVVESVDISHKTITVLHQNWNGRDVVRRQTLFLAGLTKGWLRFYHPVPAPLGPGFRVQSSFCAEPHFALSRMSPAP